MRSLALVVPKERAEEVRQTLIQMDLLRRDLRIEPGEDVLFFPVSEEVSLGYDVELHDFREVTLRPTNYRDLLLVPEELRHLLPRSFDVVGDVLILRIPEELAGLEKSIGTALLEVHKGIRTVAVDQGIVGRRRRRGLRIIAGRRSTRTVHREYGLVLALDPSKVYFSPRMAGERRRVASQVAPGEVIVDAFCGAGPFSLHVSKRGAKAVYAIDSNPDAIRFLRENVRRNRAENVVAVEGDVAEVLPTLERADRIILDFPRNPLPYLEAAALALKEGGVLHYYEILEMVQLEDRLEELREALPERLAMELLHKRVVRGYSATQAHYAFDLRVSRG